MTKSSAGDSGPAPSRHPEEKFGLGTLCRALGDLCFPPACLACGQRLPPPCDLLFCESCLAEVRPLTSPCCSCCGRPFPAAAGGDHACGTCLQHPRPFTAARASLLYTPALGKAIQGFKYRGETAALATFARLARRSPFWESGREADLIVPVPLHPRRLRERGFNQALLLARALFPEQRDRISAGLLLRSQWTPPQTGLSGAVRRRNLKGAFRVSAPEQAKGRTILLVDDVFTTGATADECARALKRAGAAQVLVFTLARALE